MEIKALITVTMLTAVMASVPVIARGQGTCLDYATLRSMMEENGVKLEGTGYIDMGAGVSTAIEVWVSLHGDFAFIAVDKNGIACIILSGAGWTEPERL
jgi:hypothetical protein